MIYTKNNMVYADYQWSAIKPDDPRIKGEPDSTLLNRREGYEVLYLINKLSERWKLSKISDMQKIEKMIRKIPADIRSQEKVKNWIYENWRSFQS